MRNHLWASVFQIRIWLLVLSLSLLTACGGGGGGGGSPNISANALSGQVVKGLASGSTVSLYKLSSEGLRTFLAKAVTSESGAFTINYNLSAGDVYLLEAVGGQYVNEISQVAETLTSPMRVVFVASGLEKQFSISAISELVALELEKSSQSQKWSAGSVATASALVNNAIGMDSNFGQKFVDLATVAPGDIQGISDEQVAYSFQVGVFAGLLHELRLRNPGISLSGVLQNFHDLVLGGDQDESLPVAYLSGLMRYVEKVPVLAGGKSAIYASVGLPFDATPAAFLGAETSGKSLESVPNNTLQLLGDQWIDFVGGANDTVFNNRGAMVAYQSSLNSGYQYVGSASIADVYATAETAIGRWNKGYIYRANVKYDAVNNRFDTSNAVQMAMNQGDIVYAAGVPATNLPTCGKLTMTLQSQTKGNKMQDGTRTLTLDASSKINFQTVSGTTFVGYNIVIRDEVGSLYTFSNSDSTGDPLLGTPIDSFMKFGSTNTLALPSGEFLSFRGMLAGVGGSKAIVLISSNYRTSNSIGLSAAFALDGIAQPCQSVNFASGVVDPVPASGVYYLALGDENTYWKQTNFFPNGTPEFPGFTGFIDASGRAKSGNNFAGVGILIPPFVSSSYFTPSSPQAYYYLKAKADSDPPLPASGIRTYRLATSTPLLTKNDDQLIAGTSTIRSAELTIYIDQQPLGVVNSTYGTCRLTINGPEPKTIENLYYRAGGICVGSSENGNISGGIPAGDQKHAVLKYRSKPINQGWIWDEAAILFEQTP